MKKMILGARIFLGLIFFVMGLNGFLNFLPMPEMPAEAGAFMMALGKSGYFLPVLKAVETVSGALLLAGFLVPLALTLLAPIIVNIFLFHVFLAPGGLPLAIVILVLEIFLAYSYRANYSSVLVKKAEPTT